MEVLTELNLDEVESQSNACRDLSNENVFIKLVQLQSMRTRSHPYPIVRVKEIRSWARSSRYDQIISGTYLKNTVA